MILVFWMSSFKTTFSLSSSTFIKKLFNSSLSAISVVSSAHLRLLIFLPAILIPACALSSPAFCIMYTLYKLNKHGDNIQPWCTPFPIWNQSVVSSPVLTVASWPAYKFLRRQVRWSGVSISLRIFHGLLLSTFIMNVEVDDMVLLIICIILFITSLELTPLSEWNFRQITGKSFVPSWSHAQLRSRVKAHDLRHTWCSVHSSKMNLQFITFSVLA